jgi:hypothetical protein
LTIFLGIRQHFSHFNTVVAECRMFTTVTITREWNGPDTVLISNIDRIVKDIGILEKFEIS